MAANIVLLRIRDAFDSISRLPFVIAVRRGLALMIPLMMMGSFALFINNLPVDAYQRFMINVFGEGWRNFGATIYQATFSIMGLCMNLTVSYTLVATSKAARDFDLNPMIGAIVSVSSLFTLIHISDGMLRLEWIGPLGVFISMVTAILSTNLLLLLCRVRFLRLKLYSNAAEPNFSQVMMALFPAVLTVCIFAAFRLTMNALGVEDIFASMYELLRRAFANLPNVFSASVVFVVMTHVFWFFGIHGNNVLEPVAETLFVPALEVNQALALQGLAPTEIFTKEFFDVFVYMGGSGTTLCLIFALLLATRRSNTRQVAAMGLLPGLINVNEIVVFGIPFVLNVYLIIPFIFVPLILMFITYFAMSWGFVPLTISTVEWTTPVIMGGFYATGSIAGSLLQVFNLVVGTLIYIPFVRIHERSLARNNERTLNNLLDLVINLPEQRERILLDRRDSEGNMARELATKLAQDLRAGSLFIHFQPQVNADGTLYGCEALLRWRHEQLGYIPPPIPVTLAEESGIMHELGTWVFRSAVTALRDLNAQGYNDIMMSVNVSPIQLDNPNLPQEFEAIVAEIGVDKQYLEIEITESAALGGLQRIETIRALSAAGFSIGMDDFGAGHSSLMYVKEFSLNTIKLDGTLVREIETNPSCRDIISSIVFLGRSLDIHLIAEFVETEGQRDLLNELGCLCYQGYLYSKPLPFYDFLAFCENMHLEHEQQPISAK